jgi:hypothetical protein
MGCNGLELLALILEQDWLTFLLVPHAEIIVTDWRLVGHLMN